MQEREVQSKSPWRRFVDWAAGVPLLRCFVIIGRHLTSPTTPSLELPLLSLVILGIAFCVIKYGGMYDTDAWFLLATGKQVVESGIPYVNPWAFDPQLPIVVQQWLHDVLMYLSYCAGGYTGVDIYAALVALVAIMAAWWVMRMLEPTHTCVTTLFAFLCIYMAICSSYMSARPTAWSMLALALIVGACIQGKQNRKWYIVLPVVVAVHVNMQAAIIGLDMFAALCFVLPWDAQELQCARRTPCMFLRSRIPLLIACACMLPAALLNPYGLKGALYVFLSIGAADYGNAIGEMRSPFDGIVLSDITTYMGLIGAVLFMVLLPLVLLIRARRIHAMPLWIIWIAALSQYAAHNRNVWIASLGSLFVLSTCINMPRKKNEALLLTSDSQEGQKGTETAMAENKTSRIVQGVCTALNGKVMPVILIVLAITTGLMASYVKQSYLTDHIDASTLGWNGLDEKFGTLVDTIEQAGGKGSRVWCFESTLYNYLEWRGFKVPLDLRPEIWDAPGITGKPNIHPFQDLIDQDGDIDIWTKDVAEKGWDWVVCPVTHAKEIARELKGHIVEQNDVYALIGTGTSTADAA